MDEALRRPVSELTSDLIPGDAGVYAWYRGDVRQYVGKAASLRVRLWNNHLGQSQALTNSALRRNVAELLGFGPAAALKRREIALTSDQLAAVRKWLLSCELAWLTCASAGDADALETKLLSESRPPLNKP
jgi:hypothetical protein